MRTVLRSLLFVFAVLFAPGLAHADPFTVTLSSNGDTRTLSFSSVSDAIDTLKNSSLEQLLPSYTSHSPATATVNLRGLTGTLSYPGTGTALVLNIPSIGLTRTFTGATRNESQDALRDFFKGTDGGGELTQILQKLASSTPADPVAGNPDALLSIMGDQDFARGTDYREGFSMSGAQTSANAFETNIQGDYLHNGVANQKEATADINYMHAFSSAGFALLVDVPVTYLYEDGAEAYSGSVGVGARVPVTSHWALTPILRVGGEGSTDLGAAAVVYSGSLTSDYRIPLDAKDTIQIGDLVGYYKTNGITVGDYHVDYDLSNVRFKNGVAFAHQFEAFPVTGKLFVNDSRFVGSNLYDNNYQEYGASIIAPLGKKTALEFGGSFIDARGDRGGRAFASLRF